MDIKRKKLIREAKNVKIEPKLESMSSEKQENSVPAVVDSSNVGDMSRGLDVDWHSLSFEELLAIAQATTVPSDSVKFRMNRNPEPNTHSYRMEINRNLQMPALHTNSRSLNKRRKRTTSEVLSVGDHSATNLTETEPPEADFIQDAVDNTQLNERQTSIENTNSRTQTLQEAPTIALNAHRSFPRSIHESNVNSPPRPRLRTIDPSSPYDCTTEDHEDLKGLGLHSLVRGIEFITAMRAKYEGLYQIHAEEKKGESSRLIEQFDVAKAEVMQANKRAEAAEKAINDLQSKLDEMNTSLKAIEEKVKTVEEKSVNTEKAIDALKAGQEATLKQAAKKAVADYKKSKGFFLTNNKAYLRGYYELRQRFVNTYPESSEVVLQWTILDPEHKKAVEDLEAAEADECHCC